MQLYRNEENFDEMREKILAKSMGASIGNKSGQMQSLRRAGDSGDDVSKSGSKWNQSLRAKVMERSGNAGQFQNLRPTFQGVEVKRGRSLKTLFWTLLTGLLKWLQSQIQAV